MDTIAKQAEGNWQRLLHVWLMLNRQQREALLSVGTDFGKLGPKALSVVTDTTARLAVGAEQYKDDFDKPREWLIEALNEAIDNNAYLMMALRQMIDVDKKTKSSPVNKKPRAA